MITVNCIEPSPSVRYPWYRQPYITNSGLSRTFRIQPYSQSLLVVVVQVWLPCQVDGVDVLEDVFEDGVVFSTAGVGDRREAIHAPTDDCRAALQSKHTPLKGKSSAGNVTQDCST